MIFFIKPPFPFKSRVNCVISTYSWPARLLYTIRFIPQGTVDNNLGLVRLADTMSLYPNHYRDPILDCTIAQF